MADQGIQNKGISKSEETKSSATGGETVDNIDIVVSAEGGSLDANEEHTVSTGERKGGISSSKTKTPATGGETVDNIDVVVPGESGSQNTNEEHTGPVVEQKSVSTTNYLKL
nr:uncharacterized protein LOC105342707 isoform X11 [Crassostrea gigas]